MYSLLKVYNSVILKENNIELAWPVKGQCADWPRFCLEYSPSGRDT